GAVAVGDRRLCWRGRDHVVGEPVHRPAQRDASGIDPGIDRSVRRARTFRRARHAADRVLVAGLLVWQRLVLAAPVATFLFLQRFAPQTATSAAWLCIGI